MTAGRVVGAAAAVIAAGFAAMAFLFAALFMGADSLTPQAGAVRPLSGDLDGLAAQLGVSPMAVEGAVIVDRASLARTGCRMPWWLGLSVAVQESGAGTSGGARIDPDWQVRPPIGGPLLDGAGFALIVDEFGAPTRARGPLQFIPSSWVSMGMDATGDGVADPDNYLDAMLSAANHLCLSAGGPGSDLAAEAVVYRATRSYSGGHVGYSEAVWARGMAYLAQGGDVPAAGQAADAAPVGAPTGNLVTLPAEYSACSGPCLLDASWAPNLLAALRAVEQRTGIRITVYSAWRSFAHQAAIYAANCPTPDCPGGLTARPGTSNHEGGQAADLASPAGSLSGPGDPAWEALKAVGPGLGVLQSPSIQGRDPLHFSATGN